MPASLKRRLDSLATAIKPLRPCDWLTPDEQAVYFTAYHVYVLNPQLAAEAEQAKRESQERASRGESEPPSNNSPEIAARWERVIAHLEADENRVRELEAEGRLLAVVDSLRAKGVWRDEWNDQEPTGEA